MKRHISIIILLLWALMLPSCRHSSIRCWGR